MLGLFLLLLTSARAGADDTCSSDGVYEEGEFAGCTMPRYLTPLQEGPQRSSIGEASQGYHLLCVQPAGGGSGGVSVRGWRDSRPGSPVDFVAAGANATDVGAFMAALRAALGAPRLPNQWGHEALRQPMALFEAATRRRIESMEALLRAGDSGGVFAIEGGQFIYPGVRVGFKQRLGGVLPGLAAPIEVETLSLRPAVFSVRHFLLPAECAHIQAHAAPTMGDSGVVLMDKDVGKPSTEWRTSTQTWLSSASDTVAQALDHRIENLTGVPRSHYEDVQVLRYVRSLATLPEVVLSVSSFYLLTRYSSTCCKPGTCADSSTTTTWTRSTRRTTSRRRTCTTTATRTGWRRCSGT
jgi:hypothetical protein